MPVVAIVVIVIIGVVLLVGCLGLVGAGFIFGLRSGGSMPAATPTTSPLPPTETFEVEQSIEPLRVQPDPNIDPPDQAPGEQNTPGETPEKP
jgi:hypothetical protein